MPMDSFTEELKKFAMKLGAAAIGTAPVDRYEQAPPGHRPGDFLPGAKIVITFAYKLNDGPINHLPQTRNEYMVEFDAANQILLRMSHRIARFLESGGYESIPFGPEGAIGDLARLKADLSHRHSAVICGIGGFGINNLLITPEHRAGVRLASVVTTAPLVYNEPLPPTSCEKCLQCVQACPSGALKNWEGNYNPQTGWTIDKEKCAHYIFTANGGKRCGLCIKACARKKG